MIMAMPTLSVSLGFALVSGTKSCANERGIALYAIDVGISYVSAGQQDVGHHPCYLDGRDLHKRSPLLADT